MKSRSFDPVAHLYDETRRLPDPVRDEGIPVLLALFEPGARLLEVGVGTGRMALPMLERGANLTGVDLSTKMMARLREKRPDARLANADALRLPFADGRFDGVLTSHVMHLIAAWPGALLEIRRVLRPGGLYVNTDVELAANAPRRRAVDYWRDWLDREAGVTNGGRPGIDRPEELVPVLEALGATVTTRDVVAVPMSFKPQDWLDTLRARGYSSVWELPEDTLRAGTAALETWLTAEFGRLDVTLEGEGQFRLLIARF